MKFEEALQAMRKGQKVRRESWRPGYHYRLDGAFLLTSDGYDAYIHANDLLATDWQIVGDPPKPDYPVDPALRNKECCKAVCQEDAETCEDPAEPPRGVCVYDSGKVRIDASPDLAKMLGDVLRRFMCDPTCQHEWLTVRNKVDMHFGEGDHLEELATTIRFDK